jgi:hypothetical protein
MYPRTIGKGFFGLLLLILAGCDSSGISRNVPAPEEMELISIDPHPKEPIYSPEKQKALDPEKYFRVDDYLACPILGRVKIEEEATRKEIMNLIQTGFNRTVKDRPKCFFPRHVVRVKNKGTGVDFVICLECLATVIQDGDAKSFGIERRQGGFRLSEQEVARLNAPLVQAGIPIAPN